MQLTCLTCQQLTISGLGYWAPHRFAVFYRAGGGHLILQVCGEAYLDPMLCCYHIFAPQQNSLEENWRPSKSQDSGRSRGFGFVTFTTSAAMDAAVRLCAQKR